MAILSEVPGLEVTIQSFGLDLPEHDDDGGWTNAKWDHVAEGKRVSKYVECQADTEFKIRMTIKLPYIIDSESITFKADVDGIAIAQISCPAETYTRNFCFYTMALTAIIERVSSTSVSRRSLKFSSLTKVDDPDSARVKKDAKAVQGLGEIVITAFRTRDEAYPFIGQARPLRNGPPTEVAEKALKGKAISNGVTYGESVVSTYTAPETIDIDGGGNPVAVFVFKYRSRKDLQSEMIIPRSPSPELAAHPLNNRGPNGANLPVNRAARLASLKREIKEIKDEDEPGLTNIPRKRSREDDDDDVQVVSRTYKTSRRPGGALIVDLTDDD